LTEIAIAKRKKRKNFLMRYILGSKVMSLLNRIAKSTGVRRNER